MSPVSIVIPTLNAAAAFGPTLMPLAAFAATGLVHELIVADGGSTDDTLAIAEEVGAQIVASEPGRGAQLAAGAAAATGDWLLFLHADTVLGDGWADDVRAFVAEAANRATAAYFRFALADTDPAARRLERMVGWRNRALALPYGDQGLLISRVLYLEIGGFNPMPLMEDVDIVRRLGRRRLRRLETPATTSAARYRREGYWRRPTRNLCCLTLYLMGAPISLVHRAYG